MVTAVSIVFSVVISGVAISIFRLSGHDYNGRRGLFLRLLCSLIYSAAAAEFLLILCEVLQAGDQHVRSFLWKTVTALLLALLVVVVPAVQILRYFVVKYPRLKVMALPVFLMYLLLFRIASLQLPIERYVKDGHKSSQETKWFTIRQDALACVSFVGITTMAFLCGISSVSAPYSAFFGDRRKVTEVDAEKLRESLLSIDEMINAKDLDISRMRLDIARNNSSSATASDSGGSNGPSGASSRCSTPKKVGSAFSLTRLVAGIVKLNDSREAQLRSLLVEHDALVKLRNEVEADLNAVLEKLRQQQYYTTFKGKVHRIIFGIFSVYCIYRVCNTYLRMCWWFFTSQPHDNPKGGPRDALVLLIATTIDHYLSGIAIGVTGWTRIIGVLMSGAVFVAALNGVLQMALRIMRRIHKSPEPLTTSEDAPQSTDAPRRINIPLDMLLVGQVVGVYILSIATTLRFNLTRSMSGPIMAALVSPLKVTSVQLWNDMVLCGTSTCLLVIIVAMNKWSAQEDTMYDAEKGDMC